MRIALLAGALALAMGGSTFALADSSDDERLRTQAVLVPAVTDAQIARFKTALNMSPDQERLWVPVEAELRSLSRRAAGPIQAGFVHQVRTRLTSIALDAVAIKRVATAAAPLIVALAEEQRRAGLRAAKEIGIGHLLAAF